MIVMFSPLHSVQGYVRGKNLHGAPYDFRKAANEHGEYFDRLKNLVEDTYTKEILSASQTVNFNTVNCRCNVEH